MRSRDFRQHRFYDGWAVDIVSRRAPNISSKSCQPGDGLKAVDVRVPSRGDREGISFSLREPCPVIVTGPTGSGKTALLGCFCGISSGASGSIYLDGVELIGKKPAEAAAMGVSYVPQRGGIFHDLTVKEDLLLSWELSRRDDFDSWKAVLEWIDETLPVARTWFERRGDELSGGQRRLLGILRGLVRQPRLLIMDEPTVGLDEERRRWLSKLVEESALRGIFTVVAVQDEATIGARCEHLVHLV